MPTEVDGALVEVQAKLDELAPQLEGLRDFDRLDLDPDTREIIRTAIHDYMRRQDRLTAARDNLQWLVDDAYPDLPVRQIDGPAYADLLEQLATIQAALAKFSAGEPAASLSTSAGPAEPKAR
jgi:hypothetical protein